MEEPPDPTETVAILRSDFELLQKVADFAVEDANALAELLGMTCPEGMAPREFFHTRLLVRVAELLATQHNVDVASKQIEVAAARFGNKTIDAGNGMQGIKVGQRDPELARLLSLSRPMSRRERREIERRGR